ncbi:hypothetical protein SPRG_05159 [Saprolegnia parasitica CBS 223.65]|uniref:Uncharacterized protein n=1 Tax=Saprolegnia parasitica (strain CBS 223.65) TaxID=695850 RepID=A0A067CGT0_SAPPC|nr:hypothetical protein SPRG_05159 [Saprolegnia parasitica CBS 223.65]KDO29969.1 hypothetical protein SPRG_05159 [Saprolegnia parasitica CBS 223.65]|eukprot:XP_012199153.1 hypothetical protein SPRG_05159 [Saprolegnia parasitica CBS 223.65]
MSLRRWARPMVRLGRTRAVAPRRLRQFSSFQRDIDGQRRGPTRYWLRVALLGLVVGSSGALLGSEDRQRAARAVVSLGRILAEIAYDQRDHSSEDAREAASAEDRIASILATMAQEQTFRQALVAHGGVQVLLKALPHANDVILRNRILTAIASVATTPGTDAALADLETTSHLLLHLPAADLPLLDRLKIDMALKHVHDVPRRPAISLPIDVAPTVHRLASATVLSRATSDERKFALQSLTSLLLTAESQSASAALDTALRTLLSNTPLVANLRELAVTPASPLQEPAATLLVALFRLSGLCGISLQEPASWHAQFVSWAYVDAPAVHVAAAEAWHLIAKQSPDVLLSSKAGQDALLQLARATFPPTSRTPSVQMHICAIVSALGDRFTDGGLGTTMATPMSRVFRDADVLDAAELDATPVLGWVDVLTQWSFHGTSAVRHHAIQSLSHLALRQDASRRVLQAWMLGLLRELFAAPV